MTLRTILAVVCALTLVLAGCAAPSTEVPTATTEPTMVATQTEPSMTETSVATTEPSATDTGTAETPTVSVPVTGDATVNVSESTTHGSILVDNEGRSLYLFTNDTQNGDASACYDDCAVEWPPLLSDGTPIAGEGIDESLLGTITRTDGTTQVTYNGWPLYYFVDDVAAGDTTGQGMENVWFLVTPLGEAVP